MPGEGGDENGGEAFDEEEQAPWGDGARFGELEDQPGESGGKGRCEGSGWGNVSESIWL